MKTKIILTRENEKSQEEKERVTKNYKGQKLTYEEVYFLDYEVDEETGMINREKMVKHYTKDQINRNLKALKNAYLIS